jgi:hypothetical protein
MIKLSHVTNVEIMLPATDVPEWCQDADDIKQFMIDQLNLIPHSLKGAGVGFSHNKDAWILRKYDSNTSEDIVTTTKTFRPADIE